MKEKQRICLVSCSVLKNELLQLVRERQLDVDLVFVSKYFHVDYEALEQNLRRVLAATVKRHGGKVVLVHGDLCLGPNGEMKKLCEEYGVVKVDALNCIDCQLGGGGKYLAADPDHNLMFMGPGMIEFFSHMKRKMLREGVDEAVLAGMFSGMKGIVLLDTCGNVDKCLAELQASGLGLPILETREVGLENVKRIVLDGIRKTTLTNP